MGRLGAGRAAAGPGAKPAEEPDTESGFVFFSGPGLDFARSCSRTGELGLGVRGGGGGGTTGLGIIAGAAAPVFVFNFS